MLGLHQLLILFIFCGVSVTLTEQQKIERINGGYDTSALEYPFMASIRSGSEHGCGAVIININTILTAAHCNKFDRVVVGETRKHAQGITHLVKWKKRHEKYPTDYAVHDILIARIVDKFIWSPTVSPISVSFTTYYPPGTEAIIIGWGYMPGGKGNYALQVAPVFVMDEEECRLKYVKSWATLGPRLCVIGDAKQQICGGDSGGPLVINNELAGIASLAFDCKSGGPSFFTNVGYYTNWIYYYMYLELSE